MKRMAVLLVFLLSCFCCFGEKGSTNAFDGIENRSKGLIWEPPQVLEGEPPITGYIIYKDYTPVFTTNTPVHKLILVPDDVITTNEFDSSNIPTNGVTTIHTNEENKVKYTYYWPEYPENITETNDYIKFWFRMVASNETGAVSAYSEACSIEVEVVRPTKGSNFESIP